MTTAEKVRERRITAGLTQDEVQNLTGLDQGHISMIESGRRKRPSGVTLAKLAKALGCTVEDLIESLQPAA